MFIDEKLKHSLNVAFNEATMLGIEFDPIKEMLWCTMSVITLDIHRKVPDDYRRCFAFKNRNDFINSLDDEWFNKWNSNLSFNFRSETNHEMTNTIDLFQEDGEKYLVLRAWFQDLEILTSDHQPVSLKEFAEAGERGWQAIYGQDKEVARFGIFPMKSTRINPLMYSVKKFWKELINNFKK